MRRAALIALAALPLLGFDCGGDDDRPIPCTLTIGGAVSEKFGCIVTVYDYSQMTPDFPEFAFMLEAFRGMGVPAAAVTFVLPARASLMTPYGWDSSTGATNVDSGDAIRYVTDVDGFPVETHSAMAPFGDSGTGKLSVTLTAIPPVSATGYEMLNVHGTLAATLPSATTGGAVTFSATF